MQPSARPKHSACTWMYQEAYLVCYTSFDGKPVELTEAWSYVVSKSFGKPCCTVEDGSVWMKNRVWKIDQNRVAVYSQDYIIEMTKAWTRWNKQDYVTDELWWVIKSIQLHDSIVRLSQKIVSFTLHYITLHYITLHYITLHYITLHYITLHYITLHYITLHYITLHYITLHYITLHYITLHYITLHYITLHYITLHYITLHYITLHYITLHYITLHYITLHYITLHYITLHYIDSLLSSKTRTACCLHPNSSMRQFSSIFIVRFGWFFFRQIIKPCEFSFAGVQFDRIDAHQDFIVLDDPMSHFDTGKSRRKFQRRILSRRKFKILRLIGYNFNGAWYCSIRYSDTIEVHHRTHFCCSVHQLKKLHYRHYSWSHLIYYFYIIHIESPTLSIILMIYHYLA